MGIDKNFYKLIDFMMDKIFELATESSIAIIIYVINKDSLKYRLEYLNVKTNRDIDYILGFIDGLLLAKQIEKKDADKINLILQGHIDDMLPF